MTKWFVYVLKTSNWRYYVWSTNNLNRRIQQHQEGKNLATKHVRPVILLYYKEYNQIKEARQMEYWLKKQKDKKTIQKFMDSKFVD